VLQDSDSESLDELLARAIRASNVGDRDTVTALADQILAAERSSHSSDNLLAAVDRHGTLRRLTLMFIDLVDSTALSSRIEVETYRTVVGSFRTQVLTLVTRYDGHVCSIKGDGLLAVFGHPHAHEDDAARAVSAGLEIVRMMNRLSLQSEQRFGVAINVRVGIHLGVVYLDPAEDDVYGFAANLASRVAGLAEPGQVAVSEAIASLVGDSFELSTRAPTLVKGIADPVHYHQVVGELAAPAPPPMVPLIARGTEQSRMSAMWRQACDGDLDRPGIALCGEAGIGKTRLARAAAELVEQSGGAVVELRGSPLHRDAGLHPVRRLLERRCEITRRTDAPTRLDLLRRELLGRGLDPTEALPLLAPVLGVGPEHGYQPAAVEGRALYQRIAATVRSYVLSCLGERPGLIIAEDVHWFDTSTSELLAALLTADSGELLVVLTGRPGDWQNTDWPMSVYNLAPLTATESDSLVDALKPGLTEAQRDAVRCRCDGIPFYIEHLVAALDAARDAARVPDALYEPLLARLHAHPRLAPVLEAAAVIGRSGDMALLSAVASDRVGDDEIDTAVTELARAKVFDLTGDNWRFRHELLREVALELPPPSRCRNLHARAAAAMTDAAFGVEPDWRVAATHYERANRFEEAVTAYRYAADAARHRGALGEASSSLTDALDQLVKVDAGSRRDCTEIAIRLERGFLTAATEGSWSGACPADFERCLTLAEAGHYEDELFTTMSALIGYYVPRAELRRARDLLDALSAQTTQDRPWSYPAIESSYGSVLWMQGEFASARQRLENAVAGRSAADPEALESTWRVAVDPISVAHLFLALTHLVFGDLDRATSEITDSLQRCDALSFPHNALNRAHSLFMDVWVRLESGQLAAADKICDEMHAFSKSAGLDYWRFVANTVHTTVGALMMLRNGAGAEELTTAAQRIADLVDASRLMNLNCYLTFHDAVIARLLLTADQPDRARERLDAALQHAAGAEMYFYDAELLRIRAATFTEVRQRTDALAAACRLAHEQGATLFELRCLLDIFAIDSASAAPALAEVLRRLPEKSGFQEVGQARTIVDGMR
jgi:class 3 adenylate cyclase